MVAIDRIAEWLTTRGPVPNRLTLAMGQLIRRAREEAGISQADLARSIYRRQSALSQIENGKMRVDAETLLYLSSALNKPIRHFFPDELMPRRDDELSFAEAQLLELARSLPPADLRRLLAQAKALVALAEVEKQTVEQVAHEQARNLIESLDE
jgi:transcriptional regulator with XRE-family HTH domain